MQVVYEKTVGEKIVAEVRAAAARGKKIEKIVLTAAEADALARETLSFGTASGTAKFLAPVKEYMGIKVVTEPTPVKYSAYNWPHGLGFGA